jgi:hypothetical protein
VTTNKIKNRVKITYKERNGQKKKSKRNEKGEKRTEKIRNRNRKKEK